MSEREVWTVDDHLRGADPDAVALWHRVDDLIRSFGDVTHSVAKTTITYKGPRRGFAGARPAGTGVRGYFDLMRDLGQSLPDDPRIRGISPYGRNLFVHQFVLRDAVDLDGVVASWLAEAYQVGCGAHLGR